MENLDTDLRRITDHQFIAEIFHAIVGATLVERLDDISFIGRIKTTASHAALRRHEQDCNRRNALQYLLNLNLAESVIYVDSFKAMHEVHNLAPRAKGLLATGPVVVSCIRLINEGKFG